MKVVGRLDEGQPGIAGGRLTSKPTRANACGCLIASVFVCALIERSMTMLWTIVFVLLVLWLLGVVSSYTVGGLVHILLVVALVVIVIRLLQGRKPLA